MHYWDISLLRVSLDLPRMPILPCINFPPVLFPIVFSIPRNLSTFHGIIIFTIIQTSITGNNVNSSLNLWFRFFFFYFPLGRWREEKLFFSGPQACFSIVCFFVVVVVVAYVNPFSASPTTQPTKSNSSRGAKRYHPSP